MIYVGIDWAEAHHDVCILDAVGAVLAKRRIRDGMDGVASLHELIGEHAASAEEVAIGIETDGGLLVTALVASGYRVHAINPKAASRYRDRHAISGAKSDAGDAKVLADAIRTDEHLHRTVAGDSPEVEAIQVLARAHQNLIWAKGRQANALRNALREFYPQALMAFSPEQLGTKEACEVLSMAPSPSAAAHLSPEHVGRALAAAGRKRNINAKAEAICEVLSSPGLRQPEPVEMAYADVVVSLAGVITGIVEQIDRLHAQLAARFEMHPDAKIITSLPGLGIVLGARVLAEFGDDRSRYADASARRNYAGTSPITRASGTKMVVLARVGRNKRLFDACYRWAFSSLAASEGARTYYDAQRARGKTNNQALRALANRWVGILHGCLIHGELYSEEVAWPKPQELAA